MPMRRGDLVRGMVLLAKLRYATSAMGGVGGVEDGVVRFEGDGGLGEDGLEGGRGGGGEIGRAAAGIDDERAAAVEVSLQLRAGGFVEA